ncbi:MAG TPA: ABC transporter ATP-binding protein [Thermodesulfobacteriota bacterium]|nr:ABC transporter ATP-binding protein [Thermodesulfobacteriota bacterium]
MVLLEAKGLTKAFGALVAVNHLDLTVEEGSIHSIIGPNGAGKTTLFNLLAGVFQPTSGIIRFRGMDITSLKAFRRSRIGIGRSFQTTSIFPKLSVRENVRLAVQSRGNRNFNVLLKASDMEEVQEKTTALLDEMEIKEIEGQTAGTIPYGTQRSLDMAIALATDPVLLLLDEPTSGMTPEDTHKVTKLIKKISERRTTVLIEHHMNLVMSISDKLTVLHQGNIIAEGRPDIIKENQEVKRAYLGGLRI